mgnify:CR=1 FL=1
MESGLLPVSNLGPEWIIRVYHTLNDRYLTTIREVKKENSADIFGRYRINAGIHERPTCQRADVRVLLRKRPAVLQ